jgi:hypothetical protein
MFSGLTSAAHPQRPLPGAFYTRPGAAWPLSGAALDEPTTLPEGTELELLPLDPGDWLDDADRAALHAAIAQSQADVEAGRVIDAVDVLTRLRSR